MHVKSYFPKCKTKLGDLTLTSAYCNSTRAAGVNPNPSWLIFPALLGALLSFSAGEGSSAGEFPFESFGPAAAAVLLGLLLFPREGRAFGVNSNGNNTLSICPGEVEHELPAGEGLHGVAGGFEVVQGVELGEDVELDEADFLLVGELVESAGGEAGKGAVGGGQHGDAVGGGDDLGVDLFAEVVG
nr:hypothetical protein Iba_chr03eCG5320 [Ipomoea batatas]